MVSQLLSEEQELALYDTLNDHYSKEVADAGKLLFNNMERWVMHSDVLTLGGPQAAAHALARATATLLSCISLAGQKEPFTDAQATQSASEFSVLMYKECELQLRTVARIHAQREKANG